MSDDGGRRPLYARVLRLRYLRPGGALCFLFFEGAAILGVLFSLAELTPWWSVAVLPATVAVMVKVNDMVAGALGYRASGEPAAVPMGGAGPARSGALGHRASGEPAAVPMGGAGPARSGALGHRASGEPAAVPMGGAGPARSGALGYRASGEPAAAMGNAGRPHADVPRQTRPAAPEAPAPADPRRGSKLPRP